MPYERGTRDMSAEFQIFISSTIDDLESIRKKVARALAGPGRLVRCSEKPDFPVEPGVTSHDACLAVVRGCHAFVLLVGARFGGEYQGQNKSITWREWEEACAHDVAPIVLVNRKTNDLCKLIGKERAKLRAIHPTRSERELDEELETSLAPQLVGYHHAPALQRFVDTVRKGHKDNWGKLDWSGKAPEAITYINHNLAVQAAAGHRRYKDALAAARAAGQSVADLSKLGRRVALLLGKQESGLIAKEDAIQGVVDIAEALRSSLFGFRDIDRYKLVVHELRDGLLHPIATAAHAAVRLSDRTWPAGKGYVGVALQQKELVLSGDVQKTDAWVRETATVKEDSVNYVSIMAKPYFLVNGSAAGVVSLTSSRLDHFTSLDDTASLAFDTLVSFINMIVLRANT